MWTVGIRDPLDPKAILGTVSLRDNAIATSGLYERGDHIRRVVEGMEVPASISIIGPDLGIADALATAVLASGLEDIGWLHNFPRYDLIAVTPDRRILRSPKALFTSTPGTAQAPLQRLQP
jgi:thiamine biosynthesis lipoprotein